MKKHLLQIIFQILLLSTLVATASAQTPLQPLPFNFTNRNSIYLRDAHLGNPIVIPQGANIDLDRNFLLSAFGTATPTQDQVQRLLLNPDEATSGRVRTEGFYESSNRRRNFDYFFPVSIRTADGRVQTGKIALNAYVRAGDISLRRTDGSDPRLYQSTTTTERLEGLRTSNAPLAATTEGACSTCSGAAIPAPIRALGDTARALVTTPVTTNNQLWNKYSEYAREFNRQNRSITRARAGHYKRLFIRGLVDRYGAREAGQIMMVMTTFGEAPARASDATQMAEMAAVMRVIENRAHNRLRTTARVLRDIGVPESADMILTNTLADWQFSAWNDRDNNLLRMISFNPDTATSATRRRMMLGFEAKAAMDSGRIQFMGRMNERSLMHYHANYVSPRWMRSSARVSAANIRVDNTTINISAQRGARHIFYAGVR